MDAPPFTAGVSENSPKSDLLEFSTQGSSSESGKVVCRPSGHNFGLQNPRSSARQNRSPSVLRFMQASSRARTQIRMKEPFCTVLPAQMSEPTDVSTGRLGVQVPTCPIDAATHPECAWLGMMGSGAVWHPQRYGFFVVLLLALASRSAWSLNSPCAPFGRASTVIHITGPWGFPSLGSSSGVLRDVNPRLLSSFVTASANSRATGFWVDVTLTPVSTFPIGPSHFPPSCASIIPPGAVVWIWADRSASAMSSANNSVSTEPLAYQMLAPARVRPLLKVARAAPKSRFCCSSNDLNATAASIFTRASRSASAVASADAALALDSEIFASNPLAVASALADSSCALATTASVMFERAVSYFDTRSSNQPSPRTPSTIRTHPIAAHFFTQSRRGYSLRSIEGVSQYLSSLDLRPYISHMSWTISGSSINRPAPTAKVHTRSQWKFSSLRLFKWSLVANSRAWAACASSGDPGDRYMDDRMTRDLNLLAKGLKGLGVTYVLTILLCIWEFTIGIKESIKKLIKHYF